MNQNKFPVSFPVRSRLLSRIKVYQASTVLPASVVAINSGSHHAARIAPMITSATRLLPALINRS